MELKIEYLNKEQLKPYANNAKLHPAEQVEQIKKSIEQFGFNDPIAIWHDNEIIEGHGRLLAVMEMSEISEVPVIRLDSLTDEQRRAYMLVHNKLTMNTDFDVDLLNIELDDIADIDMSNFGFDAVHEDEDEIEIVEDEAPEAKEGEPIAKRGEVWKLGEHYAHIRAQQTGAPVELFCAIGDEYVDGLPYSAIVEVARDYIFNHCGGFEKFAEWGLI